jgi:hypothetical protein
MKVMDRARRRTVPAAAAPTGWFRAEWALLALVIAYAVFLRAHDLGGRPFWVDEAESTINALTILEYGVPVDRYLGMPIFENTLIWQSPADPEYEFRDISYSERGLAVYHGWLPLYAMAASLAASGVRPDTASAGVSVLHDAGEMARRTRAARLPGIIFSVIFLLLLYGAGHVMGGAAGAWAALILGGFTTGYIDLANEARYYSATIMLGTAACLAGWLLVRRGRWRDYVASGMILSLLFHTHLMTCLTACLVLAVHAPRLLRHERWPGKVALAGTIMAVAILPWAVLSGFLTHASNIPMAWQLMSLPADLLTYPLRRMEFTVLLLLGVCWLGFAGLLRGRLPDHLVRPFEERAPAVSFLGIWLATGYLAFVFLIPAASFSHERISLALIPAGVLLSGIIMGAAARVLAPAWPALVAVTMTTLFLAGMGRLTAWPDRGEPLFPPATLEAIDLVRGWQLSPGARVYATPNEQLVWTVYTGLPVQSIAPVRKSFLDSFAGELVIIEAVQRHDALPADQLRQAALGHGVALTEREAGLLGRRLAAEMAYRELRAAGIAAHLVGNPAELDGFGEAMLRLQQEHNRTDVRERSRRVRDLPLYRGFSIPDHSYRWPIFFYRFVDPESRSGLNLNYAERVRDCPAHVLPSAWVIYRCPATELVRSLHPADGSRPR